MYLVLGVGLLAASFLVSYWAFAEHRRARPARWTQIAGLSSGVCILIVTVAACAIGYTVAFFVQPFTTLASMTPLLWGVLLAELVASAILLPRAIRAARDARAPAGDSATITPFPPQGPLDNQPTRARAPKQGQLAA